MATSPISQPAGKAAITALFWTLIIVSANGCGNAVVNGAAGIVGGTVVGAYSPAQEIEQVYYLGIFDPHEQLQPQQVYRVTVHGQASAISGMKFGSGWVQASLIDSLTSNAGFAKDSNGVSITQTGEKDQLDRLAPGRRLMLFGPEGFREAPKDHRLVIVMGASPEKFFAALDESIGVISQVRSAQNDPAILRQLVQARDKLVAEQGRLSDLDKDVASELPDAQPKGNGS